MPKYLVRRYVFMEEDWEIEASTPEDAVKLFERDGELKDVEAVASPGLWSIWSAATTFDARLAFWRPRVWLADEYWNTNHHVDPVLDMWQMTPEEAEAVMDGLPER